MDKKHIVKNIIVMCFGIFLFLTAMDGLVMLQSSMNKAKNVGVISQAVQYGCFFLSSLLFSTYIIEKLGSKITFITSLLCMVPFIAANYYPHFIVMIPAVILVGLTGPPLLVSQANYLNNLSDMYSEMSISSKKDKSFLFNHTKNHGYYSQNSPETCRNGLGSTSATQIQPDEVKHTHDEQLDTDKQSVEVSQKTSHTLNSKAQLETSKFCDRAKKTYFSIIRNRSQSKKSRNSYSDFDLDCEKKQNDSIKAKVFGIHGMANFSCNILSNLMSFFILKNGEAEKEILRNNSQICGAYFCKWHSTVSNNVTNATEEISFETRKVLTSVCLSLGVISVLIVIFLLDPLKSKSEVSILTSQQLMATVKFLKNKESALLTPAVFLIGLFNEFYTAEFTQAFVNCSLGIYNVSLVSVCLAFFCALSSVCSGWLVNILGRRLVIAVAALINIASFVTLLLCIPDPDHPEIFFILAGLMGTQFGAFFSQLRAFYGILFKAEENAAFSAFHLWYSLATCVSFAYSGFLCIYVKIYIILFVSIISYAGYFIVEKK